MTHPANTPLFEKFQLLKRHCKLITAHYLAARTGVYLEPDCVEVLGDEETALRVILDPSKFQPRSEETLKLLNDALQELKTYSFVTTDGNQQKKWGSNQAALNFPLGKKPMKAQSAGVSKSPWFGRRGGRPGNPQHKMKTYKEV